MPQRGSDKDRARQQPGRKRPGAAGPIRKKNCYFCKEKVAEIDYKNANQFVPAGAASAADADFGGSDDDIPF